jgi:hypothetical protein
MPNNYMDFVDEFKAGLQPADILTLLAGLRNTVPVYAALGATGTNEGHDEELARRRGPATMPAPPTIDPAESNRRAQMDFEMRYPDPRIRELLIAEMLKQSRDPYSPTTATRRRDFEEAPMRADQFMSAAPKKKKFANGGAIDFSTPDMADGGRFIPDPQSFNRGGGVKKTLDQMQAEIAQKLKPQPQPDLSRRKFFGLGKAEQLMPFDSAMQLNKKDPAFQEALALYMHDNRNMFKNAPAITEKTVTVDPGKGAAKSTLKSLSETPVSRREVLKSAAGQALRGVLPDLGGLSAIGNVAKVAETAAAPTALPSSMIAPLLAQAAEQGMKLSDALKFVRSKVPNADELFELEETFRNYKNPSRMDYEDDLLSPSDVMRDLLAAQEKPSIMAARPEMRAMRGMAPKKYEELKDVSRDFSMQSIENALGRGVLRGEDEVEMFLRGDPKIWEIIGNR